MTGAALVIGMARPLRCHDILIADLHGNKKHLASGRDKEGDYVSYIIIGFLGKFKGETIVRCPLIPVASTTYCINMFCYALMACPAARLENMALVVHSYVLV